MLEYVRFTLCGYSRLPCGVSCVLTRIRIYHNCFAVVCFVMIPRSLVKHQYESVGTKDGLSGPAVFLFPAKGAHLVQLQPSNNAEQRLCFAWVRQSEEEWGV